MKKLLILSTLAVVSTSICEGSESPFSNTSQHNLLVNACVRGEVNSVKYYIENGANPNTQDNNGHTLLGIACRNNNENMVKALIEECFANIDEKDAFGNTPLITATYHKRTNIVKYLLEHGAEVNIQGEGGKTALSIAKTYNENGLEAELLKCLIDNGAEESSYADPSNEKEMTNR